MENQDISTTVHTIAIAMTKPAQVTVKRYDHKADGLRTGTEEKADGRYVLYSNYASEIARLEEKAEMLERNLPEWCKLSIKVATETAEQQLSTMREALEKIKGSDVLWRTINARRGELITKKVDVGLWTGGEELLEMYQRYADIHLLAYEALASLTAQNGGTNKE